MSNSSLVNYIKISPHKNSPRNNKIKKITIHHMAGNLSVETCGNVFQSREASSNYGIDSNGRVGMYVEEKDRSWASSSPSNDNQAVTIEVANDGGASTNWHVSDKALAKLIDLCVDICKRNGIKQLNYTGDSSGNLTRHNMFAATSCPGPYLQSKFPYIASEVNKRLNGGSSSSDSGSSDSKDNLYRVRKTWKDAASQKGAFSSLSNAKACADKNPGYYVFDESGKSIYPVKEESKPTTTKVNVTYKVKANGRWLPEVKNLEDYAGNIGQKITDIAIKVDKGSVKYRVRTNGRWLPYVTGYNTSDYNNGYAGNGTPIDCVEVYYYTPDNIRPYQQAYYRVSPVNKGYYSWQKDNSTADGMDGYAGAPGVAIDRFQIQIK